MTPAEALSGWPERPAKQFGEMRRAANIRALVDRCLYYGDTKLRLLVWLCEHIPFFNQGIRRAIKCHILSRPQDWFADIEWL